jgi:FMN phosphatase YigB (HAD superfamily)
MSIPRPPKAITFDCWSTLINDIDWKATVRRRVEVLVEVAARHRVELHPERAAELIEGSWKVHVDAWRRGEVFGNVGASRWCAEQLGVEAPEQLADELAEAIGGTSEGGTYVIEGAAEALVTVREAGIPTALVCDTGFTPGSQVRRFLDEHGLELDHYFFSDEVGSPKPYPRIFLAALEALGVDPSYAVHIGDLRRTDVAGARGVGMATIRFTGAHDDGWESESEGEEADAVLARWADLPAIIGTEG